MFSKIISSNFSCLAYSRATITETCVRTEIFNARTDVFQKKKNGLNQLANTNWMKFMFENGQNSDFLLINNIFQKKFPNLNNRLRSCKWRSGRKRVGGVGTGCKCAHEICIQVSVCFFG